MNNERITRIRETGKQIIDGVFEFYKHAEILNYAQIKEIENKIIDSPAFFQYRGYTHWFSRKNLKSLLDKLEEENQIKEAIKMLIFAVRNEKNISGTHLNN